MNLVERNKQLFILIDKLMKAKDYDAIELIKTFVENDHPSIKKTFEIMTIDLVTDNFKA